MFSQKLVDVAVAVHNEAVKKRNRVFMLCSQKVLEEITVAEEPKLESKKSSRDDNKKLSREEIKKSASKDELKKSASKDELRRSRSDKKDPEGESDGEQSPFNVLRGLPFRRKARQLRCRVCSFVATRQCQQRHFERERAQGP
jgi:hypothetical protein